MFREMKVNIDAKKYLMNLLRISMDFSTIFHLENSGIFHEGTVNLKDLEKNMKLSRKFFDKALESNSDDENEYCLNFSKKVYKQVEDYFSIIKSHYNNVVANKKQLELLISFRTELKEQIDMFEALVI